MILAHVQETFGVLLALGMFGGLAAFVFWAYWWIDQPNTKG